VLTLVHHHPDTIRVDVAGFDLETGETVTSVELRGYDWRMLRAASAGQRRPRDRARQ
jgi:hypothetical protein